MKYKNLKYSNLEKYSKLKNKYIKEGWMIVELNGKNLQNEKALYASFKRVVKAPRHFYYNINSFIDLLYDFSDLGNPNRVVIMVKDHPKIREAKFLDMIFEILDCAVGYWKEHRKAKLDVWVFNL